MRATTRLENLIDKVENMSCGNFDETISLQKMEFASLDEMWIENVSVDVLPHAQSLLSNRLGVSFTYLKRCPSELQAARHTTIPIPAPRNFAVPPITRMEFLTCSIEV